MPHRIRKNALLVLLGLSLITVGAPGPAPGQGQVSIAEQLALNSIERRAVETAIWGMPIVSVDAMRQAFFYNAEAQYGDIVYLSQPADWKFQVTTPNASSLYAYLNFNTKDGPVVIDFPAAEGAGLFGSLNDAWQVPLIDVGPAGEDKGNGAKYLVLPPNYNGGIPAGHVPVRSKTYNGYALFRAIPVSSSDADVAKAIALVKRMRVYPLAQAANPPAQRHIDMTGKLFDGIVRYDDGFYESLARMVNEEPIQPHDLIPMAQLRTLGIEKGKEFRPDPQVREILRRAVSEARVGFAQAAMGGQPFWPGTQWVTAPAIGPQTEFSFVTNDRLDIDARGMTFFLACAPPRKLGAATFYIGAFRDANGAPLLGDQTYRLRIPPNVPVKQYWAATVYDLGNAAF